MYLQKIQEKFQCILETHLRKEWSNLDIINALGSVPLQFQPGEGWRYGISADVIGGIVEVVSGKPYGEYLEEMLFEPLEMKDTGFYIEESQFYRLAQMYSRVDEKGRAVFEVVKGRNRKDGLVSGIVFSK